eukprot:1394162-Amorphochlora_amoeboformis.AAC.1
MHGTPWEGPEVTSELGEGGISESEEDGARDFFVLDEEEKSQDERRVSTFRWLLGLGLRGNSCACTRDLNMR